MSDIVDNKTDIKEVSQNSAQDSDKKEKPLTSDEIEAQITQQEKTPKRKKLRGRINIRKLSLKNLRRTMAFKFASVLFVFLLLSFFALAFILLHSIKKDNTETYTNFSTQIAERTADGLTYWLESYLKDFGIFSKSYAFTSGDFELACQYLNDNHALIDPSFDFIGIADQSGNMYSSNGTYQDVAHEPFFTEIQTNGKSSYISDPYPSPDGIGYIFYISAPVNNTNNSFWGVIVGALALSKVNYQITQTTLGQNSFTFALDSDGDIIAHSDPEKIMKNFYNMRDEATGYKGYHEMVQRMLLSQTGSAIVEDSERNATNYVFFCPINHTNWSLAIAMQQAEISESAMKSTFKIVFISVLIAIILLVITSVYMRVLVHPLVKLKNSITEIASGEADLTKRIQVKSKDEIGEVVMGFNTFTENLRLIIKHIKESKDELAEVDAYMAITTKETSSSINEIISHINTVGSRVDLQGQSVKETAEKVSQIAQSIESLNSMIETQSAGVAQASAAVEQMIGNIVSVTRSTEKMVDSFVELENDTTTGIEKQNSVNEQIQRIQEQSLMLMEANKVISQIASETNLLAMNASIEAAHAGDAGRGFSVVADEIRVLSETSSKQSKRIKDELQKIQDSIGTVVQSSAEAKDAFKSVTEKIHETDQLVQQIKGAMEESEVGSHQITDALKMMNESTTDVHNASGHMSSGNQGILDQIKKLQTATEEITSNVEQMTSSAKQISNNGKTLSDNSETMQSSIAKIGAQIDLFKV